MITPLRVALLALLLVPPSVRAGDPTATICHFPPGNRANFQTITISRNALATHLAHGDFNGPCANDCNLFPSVCNDGNPCTADVCNANGTCSNPPNVTCTASDPCHVAGTCDPASGQCSNPVAPAGTSCNDGNRCTTNDTCTEGTCAGTAVTCSASDPCHVAGTCDPSTGACSNPVAVDGTTCDDGNACTQNDTCQTGTCKGGPTLDCAGCPDTTPCDDGNICTVNDTCLCAVCVGGTPLVCPGDGIVGTEDFCDPTVQACVHVDPNTIDSAALPGALQCDLLACPAGKYCCPTTTNGFCADDGLVCDPPDGVPCGTTACDPTKGQACCDNTACCGPGTTCDGHGACIPSDPTWSCIPADEGGSAACCNGVACCAPGTQCDTATAQCLNVCDNEICRSGQTCCPGSTKGCCDDATEVCFAASAQTQAQCVLKRQCPTGETYIPSLNSCCADVATCSNAQGEPVACCDIAAGEVCGQGVCQVP